MRAILDTDILSEVLKAKDPNVKSKASAYRAEEGRYTFSTITVMEIIKGLSRKRRDDAIQRFLVVVDDSERAPPSGPVLGPRKIMDEIRPRLWALDLPQLQ